MSTFQQAVGAVLARVRPGEVVTYGEVAAEAVCRNRARVGALGGFRWSSFGLER
ncbi:MAG: MGMT family protein [Egibacteraceae bacterium]